MSDDTVNIGLIGFGTIGSGVVEVFNKNAPIIENKVKKKVNLKRIVDLDTKTDRGVFVNPEKLSTNVDDILDDPEIDIVIELIGGYQPALSFIKKAMANGKHVVTANKALLSEYWDEIIESSVKNNVRICFEASVGGGIPILNPLNESLAANNIKSIYGIINGTANYILTKMADEKRDFEEVLKEAQLKGYAEQDPTFDIEGYDTAHKLIILTILGFGVYVKLENFHIEGINRIKLEDIEFADRELNRCIKLLAISRISNEELEVRVHPTLVSETHLLSSVNDVFNGIYIEGDAVGPVMMYGQGAGMIPTASAIVGDCIDLIENGDKKVVYGPQKNFAKIKDINDIESKYYIRLTVIDRPGVLHEVSGILSKLNISLESVHQDISGECQVIPIFLVTHDSLERNIREAVMKIDELDFIKDKTLFIRML